LDVELGVLQRISGVSFEVQRALIRRDDGCAAKDVA
jgi:hypothetical protein